MEIRKIFEEYEKKKDEIEISVQQMKKELGGKIEHIVLYGAGSSGIAFLYYLRDVGIYPLFFADGNPDRWGTTCEGIEVIDYHTITERAGDDALVIVTINTDGKKYCKSFADALRAGGHEGVHKSLRDAGCKNVIDYTWFRRCTELFHGDKYNLPSCSDVNEMTAHIKEIETVHDRLADDKSKEIFEKIVEFRMLDDTIAIPTSVQDKQYFEYDFFPKINDEAFVDCGAFNGISLKAFLQENNNTFESYYGMEPDAQNYKSLCEYVDTLPGDIRERMHLIPKAAYDSDKGTRLYALHGPGSFIADIGTQQIETVTIDEMLDGDRASLIKMNIEGSELKALRGARCTIQTHKPRLAIAGYHKTHDLWEVPITILEMDENYKLYLRSYMNHISFIYYAYV